MSLKSEKRSEIKLELLRLIYNEEKTPAITASKNFGISKQTAYRYLSALIFENKVTYEVTNNQRIYSLVDHMADFSFDLSGLEEDIVWSKYIKPLLAGLKDNVLHACYYGFTEMLNNAIDHSESNTVTIAVRQNEFEVKFWIIDYGIGIFTKIQNALGLDSPRQSILELAKGKLTTAPSKHTGEGIFFTSRIFNIFRLYSKNLVFTSGRNAKIDILFDGNKRYAEGTMVNMEINKESDVITGDVFDSFSSPAEDYGFTKTYIPVHLIENEGAMLVSRSQAKRLVARFDKFKEIVLDFEGIEEVGQAFADELFRVFAQQHPDVELLPVKMNEKVKKMVMRALTN